MFRLVFVHHERLIVVHCRGGSREKKWFESLFFIRVLFLIILFFPSLLFFEYATSNQLFLYRKFIHFMHIHRQNRCRYDSHTRLRFHIYEKKPAFSRKISFFHFSRASLMMIFIQFFFAANPPFQYQYVYRFQKQML